MNSFLKSPAGVTLLGVFMAIITSLPARASDADGSLDSARLPIWLSIPFAGILLSIAFGPVFVRRLWHLHYGKTSAFWAALSTGLLVYAAGLHAVIGALFHVMVIEYLPFILMLFALFTAAGGVALSGTLRGTPLVNAALLALGTGLASIIGTTGASLILIQPLLRANRGRRAKAHIVIFFIFLVSNMGGIFSPLGDPPLFLGFLHGIDFFWPAQHLWRPALFAIGALLGLFMIIDWRFYNGEKRLMGQQSQIAGKSVTSLRISGSINIMLIAVAILAVIMSGVWHPNLAIKWMGTRIGGENILRDVIMIGIGCASLFFSGKEERRANNFSWDPLKEVAQLFAGIFTCMIPVMAMLHASQQGPFGAAIGWLTGADGAPRNALYFWATGLLSSCLDNAPAYLVFFQLAGGDPVHLMGPMSTTLAAISLGAVFMGAMSYIGNAPNFMVYAIARRHRVAMPSFFGYLLWSGMILIPLFTAMTWLFV